MANIIYPDNINKYAGCVSQRGKAFRYIYTKGGVENRITFQCREDAEDYLMTYAVSIGDVKNILYDFGDYYEVELNQEKKTKRVHGIFHVD